MISSASSDDRCHAALLERRHRASASLGGDDEVQAEIGADHRDLDPVELRLGVVVL